TTRDTLEEGLQWDGWPVVLTDTAGLRLTADAVEKEGTRRTRRALDRADVAVVVVDASAPLTREDREVAGELKATPAIAALNKSDKPPALSGAEAQASLGISTIVPTSAVTGRGLADLRTAVTRTVITPALD